MLEAARSLRPTHYAQWMTMTRCANVSIGLPVRGSYLPTLLGQADAGEEVESAPCLACKVGRPVRSFSTFFVDDNGLGENVSMLN